ncbi:MAG TPA: KH domain-containing protein [archaeon]|nr:KH domain-containing protein [archaeon]
MIKSVKIPDERIPVLIGNKGLTKRLIEKATKTKISIEEDVLIEGESLNVMTAENIVKAIGRGFSPDNAEMLLDEDCTFELLELPKNEQSSRRIRSRLIGTSGKCRRNIERLTGTRISVYGKTVAIIGKYTNAHLAAQAVEKIIKGIPHRSVYEFLEGKQDERDS